NNLKALQAKSRIWPPLPERPDQKGWRLKFRGYQHDDVLTRTLKTDTNGAAALDFTPEREGYYRIAWTSDDAYHETQYATDTKQIIVPPTKNFLTVDVKPDRSQYQPRDEGSFVVTTRNDAGRPVSAEVAFGLVDESVFYIQSDYAGDPRQFYFGTKRQHPI